MTIKQAYQHFCGAIKSQYGLRETLSMARILFADVYDVRNFDRLDELKPNQLHQLEEIIRRLADHEPLQYILESADFYGLQFKVGPGVLIPRPETEELVFTVLEYAQLEEYGRTLKVLDIGTGSGCIPITLAKKRPTLEVHATDISKEALHFARQNAKTHRVNVQFFENDIREEEIWDDFEKYDYIISNPPYIPYEEEHLMPLQVKGFEPHLALFVPDEHPQLFYQLITRFAKQKLKNGGRLFFETNEFRAQDVAEGLRNQGFIQVEIKQDMSDKDRMVMGVKPAGQAQI